MRGIGDGQPFKASRGGFCRACGLRWDPGAWIVGQGKGYGALHRRCARTYGLVINKPTAGTHRHRYEYKGRAGIFDPDDLYVCTICGKRKVRPPKKPKVPPLAR